MGLSLSVICGLIWLPQSVSASVEDFKFKSLTTDYSLARVEGRSEVRIKETFVAVFPDFDQNRGFARSIPINYDGHTLSLELGEIKRDGVTMIPAKDSIKDGYRRLELRDGDNYVYGEHRFEINYRYRDVILNPDDSLNQEFYWDVNGTGWKQPFETVVANIYVETELLPELTGRMVCYTGSLGSKNQACSSEKVEINQFKFISNGTLQAAETLTFGIEFKMNTFAAYQPTGMNKALINGIRLIVVGLVTSLAYLTGKRVQFGLNAKVNQPVVVQYLPPEGIEVLQSSVLMGSSKLISVALVDLAVRHKIIISELPSGGNPKSIFAKLSSTKDYKLTLESTTGISPNEVKLLQIYFPGLKLGSIFNLEQLKNDYYKSYELMKLSASVPDSMKADGYYQKPGAQWVRYGVWSLIGAIISIVGVVAATSGASSLLYYQQEWLIPLVLLVGIGFAILTGLYFGTNNLSPEGSRIKHYLLGLKMYIKLAEADRIKYLQSVLTADRKLINIANDEQKVVLYERVLPYAMIFGLEKTWTKILENIYLETSNAPYWYHGTNGFSSSNFNSAISRFSGSMSSSSGSGSSSFGGGGSSGGGGGGGGGGGI